MKSKAKWVEVGWPVWWGTWTRSGPGNWTWASWWFLSAPGGTGAPCSCYAHTKPNYTTKRDLVRSAWPTHTATHTHTAAHTHRDTHTPRHTHTPTHTHCGTHTLRHTHTLWRTHTATHWPAAVDLDRQDVVVEAVLDQTGDLRLGGDLPALQTFESEQRHGRHRQRLHIQEDVTGTTGRAPGSNRETLLTIGTSLMESTEQLEGQPILVRLG